MHGYVMSKFPSVYRHTAFYEQHFPSPALPLLAEPTPREGQVRSSYLVKACEKLLYMGPNIQLSTCKTRKASCG